LFFFKILSWPIQKQGQKRSFNEIKGKLFISAIDDMKAIEVDKRSLAFKHSEYHLLFSHIQTGGKKMAAPK